MNDHRLRFALIGTGDFGRHFAPYITEVAELVAVCDPDPDSRAEFAGQMQPELPVFDDHESLLDSVDVDAVAITSPNFTHKDIAVAAANRGRHVYCEKAMACNVPECWEMVQACESAGVRLMVGHKRRLRPPWARMMQLRKTLGRPLAITSCAYHDARSYGFPGTWWSRRDKSGGTLPLIGVHIIDWMRAMCGDVATVRALAAPQIESGYEFPDTLHVQLTFLSGAVASLNVSLSCPPIKFREAGGPVVVCENGGMRFVPHLDHLDLHWQHQDDPEPEIERFDDLGFDHAYRRELGDFVRWITSDTQSCLTWEEGLRCVEVMEAAHRSADENGTIITLPLYPELENTE